MEQLQQLLMYFQQVYSNCVIDKPLFELLQSLFVSPLSNLWKKLSVYNTVMCRPVFWQLQNIISFFAPVYSIHELPAHVHGEI